VADIIPIKTPDIDLSFEELVHSMQKLFADKNWLEGLLWTTINGEVDKQLSVNRLVFEDILRDHWEMFFPGVPYNEERLSLALEKFLEGKRDEIVSKLRTYLTENSAPATIIRQKRRGASLILSKTVLETIQRKPCGGTAHDFRFDFHQENSRTITIGSYVVSRWLKQPRWYNYPCHNCGQAPLRYVRMTIVPCSRCGMCCKAEAAYMYCHCDTCDEYTMPYGSGNAYVKRRYREQVAAQHGYRLV